MRTLSEYRGVIAGIVASQHGRVVDMPGDNILAEFGSAVDAVEAALAPCRRNSGHAMRSCPRRGAWRSASASTSATSSSRADRIYGDGVNIAARVEALAHPGGICVSAKVHDEVHRKLELAFEDLGEHELKNIAGARARVPRRRGCPSGRAPGPPRRRPTRSRRSSCCPFANMSGAAGAGILRRRADRGHPDRPVALPRAVRDFAQYLVQVQGPGGGREEGRARTRRPVRRRGQRAQAPATGCASPCS